jgi:hypothetical protein
MIDPNGSEPAEGDKSLQSTSTAASGFTVNNGAQGEISPAMLIVIAGGLVLGVVGIMGLVILSRKGK